MRSRRPLLTAGKEAADRFAIDRANIDKDSDSEKTGDEKTGDKILVLAKWAIAYNLLAWRDWHGWSFLGSDKGGPQSPTALPPSQTFAPAANVWQRRPPEIGNPTSC
jgi:hypothetical protein